MALAGIRKVPGPKSKVGWRKRCCLRLRGRCRLCRRGSVTGVRSLSELVSSSCERWLEFLVFFSAGRGVAPSESLVCSGSVDRRLSSECARFLPREHLVSAGSPGGDNGCCLSSRNSVVDRSLPLLLLVLFLHILLLLSRPLGAASMLSAESCIWLVCSDNVVFDIVVPLVVSALCRGSVKSASVAVTPPPPETLPGPQR
jgi:hypothetical protein